MENSGGKVFVVFNPAAGNAAQADEVRSALKNYFTAPRWALDIYETTGKEDVADICRKACKQGATLVIAAGGDGTVVDVANGLVNGDIPLGILPLGTGNDLARVLSIPLKLDEALEVMSQDSTVIPVDALKVGDRYFFSNVSVGISPVTMAETKPEQKKRFGRLAYLWTMVKRAKIFHLRRYTLTVDGQPRRIRASEVLVSNTTLLEAPPHLFGPPETLNDGQLETYLVTARTPGDYARLVWGLIRHPRQRVEKLHHWVGKHCIRIEADGRPQLVQADGEVIGHTPVEIEMIPKAIQVMMPREKLTEAPA
jgi:YegS/Rv2252/BmrU family lipid kinase